VKCFLKKWRACCERHIASLGFIGVGQNLDKLGNYLLLKDISIELNIDVHLYITDAYKLFSTALLAVFYVAIFKIHIENAV
jgi:hypothetical protein